MWSQDITTSKKPTSKKYVQFSLGKLHCMFRQRTKRIYTEINVNNCKLYLSNGKKRFFSDIGVF